MLFHSAKQEGHDTPQLDFKTRITIGVPPSEGPNTSYPLPKEAIKSIASSVKRLR